MKQIIISGTAASGKTTLASIISDEAYKNPMYTIFNAGDNEASYDFNTATLFRNDVVVYDGVSLEHVPAILRASNHYLIDVVIITNAALIQLFK